MFWSYRRAQLIDELAETFSPVTPLTIARNNLTIGVLFFIPIVGLGLLTIVSYNTGVALAALATIEEVPALTLFLALLSSPVTWIDAIDYIIAAAQGVMWLLGLLSKRLWAELRNLLMVVLVVSMLMVLGALWESVYTSSLNIRRRGFERSMDR